MRHLLIISLHVTAVGCSTRGLRDERLIGTWRSNGEQAIAQMLQHDPRWANAPPEKVQKLRAIFGTMTITYGDRTITTR